MPAEQNSYAQVPADYFAKRGLRRYAGVASLWALGVGAVISGHYSGWNLGLLAGGWGGLALAALVIAVMYLGLVFCIAEMGAALPHTGAPIPSPAPRWAHGGASSPGCARTSNTC